MRINNLSACILSVFLTCYIMAIEADVTFTTIKGMTEKMEKLTNKITSYSVNIESDDLLYKRRLTGKRVSFSFMEDTQDHHPRKEVNTVKIAAGALLELNEYLSKELNKPITQRKSLSGYLHNGFRSLLDRFNDDVEYDFCTNVKKEFRSFLVATVYFLYAIEEKSLPNLGQGDRLRSKYELKKHTKKIDASFNSKNKRNLHKRLVRLQSLWSSRKPNKQDLSFIEQQISLYDSTKCFESNKDQVLKNNLEIVEYLNTLIEISKED